MTEVCFGMFGYVTLQMLPAFLVVPYFLAIHADRNYPFELLYLGQCAFQLHNFVR